MNDLSPESRKLIEHSRHAGGPTAAQRAAMKTAILGAVLIPGAAAASTAGAVKAAGLSVAAKIGLVVAAVSVSGLVTWQVMASSPVEPVAVVAEAVAEPVVEEIAAPVAAPVPEEVPEVVVPPAPVAVPKPVVVKRPVVVAAPPPPPAPIIPTEKEVEATLAKEVAALAGAMGAVDGKQFTVALEQVSGYRDAFPNGLLETEAGVLEVLALCGLKRVDEAREAARSLPVNNPAVRRLERSCIRPGGK